MHLRAGTHLRGDGHTGLRQVGVCRRTGTAPQPASPLAGGLLQSGKHADGLPPPETIREAHRHPLPQTLHARGDVSRHGRLPQGERRIHPAEGRFHRRQYPGQSPRTDTPARHTAVCARPPQLHRPPHPPRRVGNAIHEHLPQQTDQLRTPQPLPGDTGGSSTQNEQGAGHTQNRRARYVRHQRIGGLLQQMRLRTGGGARPAGSADPHTRRESEIPTPGRQRDSCLRLQPGQRTIHRRRRQIRQHQLAAAGGGGAGAFLSF